MIVFSKIGTHTLQTPQATVHSSLVAEAWFAWHSIHRSIMWFRQIAQLSTTISGKQNHVQNDVEVTKLYYQETYPKPRVLLHSTVTKLFTLKLETTKKFSILRAQQWVCKMAPHLFYFESFFISFATTRRSHFNFFFINIHHRSHFQIKLPRFIKK